VSSIPILATDFAAAIRFLSLRLKSTPRSPRRHLSMRDINPIHAIGGVYFTTRVPFM
jgi:hypothetical protein